MYRLEELVWDEWNEDHIARHGVSGFEVEEAVFSPRARFLRSRHGRYQVLGTTEAGRYLFVVLALRPRRSAYPITARPMTEGEKRMYRRTR